MAMKLSINNLAKIYGERIIFKHVTFTTEGGDIFVVTGPNGSGKSTLLKSIISLVPVNAGSVSLQNDKEENIDLAPNLIGLCAPYLNLYLNFSLAENLKFFNMLRGVVINEEWIEKSGIQNRLNDHLKDYSSGMLQRARLLFAIAHEPNILILDEPASNLDDEGFHFVEEIVKFQKKKGKITLLATNDNREKQFGNKFYELGETD